MLRQLCIYLSVVAAGVAASARAQSTPEDIAKAQQEIARYQQTRMDWLKNALDSPDPEFKVLQPKLLRVMILQYQYQQSIGFTGFARRTRTLTGPVALVLPPSEVQKARMELDDALLKEDVTTGEIVEKLKAFRVAKAAAREELLQAQADLRDFLTLRQESVLVGMGVLD
jgi:hypothetical protein